MKWIVVVCTLLLQVVNAQLPDQHAEAMKIAREIVRQSAQCFQGHMGDQREYQGCVASFCQGQCGQGHGSCQDLCLTQGTSLYEKLSSQQSVEHQKAVKALQSQARDAANEQAAAMSELLNAQSRMVKLNAKISDRAAQELRDGDAVKGHKDMAKAQMLAKMQDQIKEHLSKVKVLQGLTGAKEEQNGAASFLQMRQRHRNPEDDLAKEMTHDLEMNFNKIAPFGKEDTAKELQDHAAKTQDTLVDAVENAEVAEIKRAVFRALTRLRAATIKEFDTIARLETQAIDAYNDAHHYRAENPLAHLHEDEAPVETDKLKSFH